MLRKQFIILTALVVVIGLYALFAALWDRSDPKAAMLHDVSANFTIYLTYGGTDYAEGSSIDIDQNAGAPGDPATVKVKDQYGTDVTTDWAVFPGWTATTNFTAYTAINCNVNAGRKFYYQLNNNQYVGVAVVCTNANAEIITGGFTLY